jgi:hypothetical protein
MQFMVRMDGNRFDREVRELLDAMKTLFRTGQGMFVSGSKAGGIGIESLWFDEIIDEYARRGGESAETLWSDYYYAKAVACGMANKQADGLRYYRKARERRTGGPFAEWCQSFPFYKGV